MATVSLSGDIASYVDSDRDRIDKMRCGTIKIGFRNGRLTVVEITEELRAPYELVVSDAQAACIKRTIANTP